MQFAAFVKAEFEEAGPQVRCSTATHSYRRPRSFGRSSVCSVCELL